MPLINKCCGMQLRTGTYVCCLYSMIYSLAALGIAAYGISNYLVNIQTAHKSLQAFNLTSMEMNTAVSMEARVLYIASCVDIGLYALLAIVTMLVLVGLCRLQRYFFIPYLTVMGMLTVLQIITCLLFLIVVVMFASPVSVGQLFMAVLFTLVDVQCLRCVGLYYRELRDGRAQIRANYSIRVPEFSDMEKTSDMTMDFKDEEAPPPYSSLIGGTD
ncbi:uncharacterized protein LOC117293841 [Asterias rubens]|uniref:uncharacterized protein LOC117293841 n=1 Tax=Asterias rubens TaxID=7604 RepID=UPI0014554A9F|nr:uncharacterized protein LOC117293841 [Asterias rubens]